MSYLTVATPISQKIITLYELWHTGETKTIRAPVYLDDTRMDYRIAQDGMPHNCLDCPCRFFEKRKQHHECLRLKAFVAGCKVRACANANGWQKYEGK